VFSNITLTKPIENKAAKVTIIGVFIIFLSKMVRHERIELPTYDLFINMFMVRNCLNCNIFTSNKKFCCRSCANGFNTKGQQRNESKFPKKEKNYCLFCNTKSYNPKYCSNECQKLYQLKLTNEIIETNEIIFWRAIKRYLIEKNYKCFICGINQWNNKEISLECDHIDGDITNNRLSNARLLCPNCHSQTETFKYKNTGNPKGKEARQQRYKKSLKN
jgi:hypothetical protein